MLGNSGGGGEGRKECWGGTGLGERGNVGEC